MEELNEKYPWSTNPEARARFIYVGSLYQNLGLLLQEKIADPNLIFRIFGPASIITTWRKYEPVVKEMRSNSNDPTHWDAFEYLADEARRRYPEVTIIPFARL